MNQQGLVARNLGLRLITCEFKVSHGYLSALT